MKQSCAPMAEPSQPGFLYRVVVPGDYAHQQQHWDMAASPWVSYRLHPELTHHLHIWHGPKTGHINVCFDFSDSTCNQPRRMGAVTPVMLKELNWTMLQQSPPSWPESAAHPKVIPVGGPRVFHLWKLTPVALFWILYSQFGELRKRGEER